MFSRAAKSIVSSFGSRQIHIGEKNFKIALIAGGTEEFGRTVSQLLRDNNKLNIFVLYNTTVINRPPSNNNTYNTYDSHDDQRFKLLPSGMLMTKKFCSVNINRRNTAINNTNKVDNNATLNRPNHQGNNGTNQTQKLVEALYVLPPIAGEVVTLDNVSMSNKATSKAKRRVKSSSWDVPVAKENDRQSLTPLSNGDETLARGPANRSRSIGILANAEPRSKAIGKSASWMIPASCKPRLLHKTCTFHGRRPISRHSVNELHVARNYSTNMRKEHLRKQGDTTHEEDPRSEFANTGAIEIPSGFLSSTEDQARSLVSFIRARYLENGNLQTGKYPNDVSGRSSALNVASHVGCEVDADSRGNNNETTRLGTLSDRTAVERRDWIQRVYASIGSTFRDLHATVVRSYPATSLDPYGCLGDTLALNESIPAANAVISGGAVLFARKKDSKSKIRRKIEEFCAHRKNSLKRKPSRDDICDKRKSKAERKTACQPKDQCQKTEKPCQKKKKPDCSKKWLLTRQKRVIYEQKKSDRDKRGVRDCLTTMRKVDCQEQPCTRRKDDDIRKKALPTHKAQPCTRPKRSHDVCKPTPPSSCEESKPYEAEDKSCTKPKDASCRSMSDSREERSCAKPKDEPREPIIDSCKTSSYKEKDFCTESGESVRRKSVYEKCVKTDKPVREEKDEDASCKREARKVCQATRRTLAGDERKKEESKVDDRVEIKKIDPCKKKICPTVVKAPDCPEDDGKKSGS